MVAAACNSSMTTQACVAPCRPTSICHRLFTATSRAHTSMRIAGSGLQRLQCLHSRPSLMQGTTTKEQTR